MVDLDEVVARAVGDPVAAPPDLSTLQQRARQGRRVRIAKRTAVAAGGAVALSLGVAILIARSGTSSPVAIAPPAGSPSTTAAITRPLLEGCTATEAREGVQTGAGKSDPDQPGEVFADAARGIEGPLAVLLRMPGDGRLDPLAPNTSVGGRPANFGAGDQGQAGISWVQADGGIALLSTRDLSDDDVRALAEAIDAATNPLPGGLVSLGMTTAASWARSSCAHPVLGSADVEVIRGSIASRYARVLAGPPGDRWDVGDVTFLVVGSRGGTPTIRPSVRQATRSEWDALLARGTSP